MIRLYDYRARVLYFAPRAIMSVEPAGPNGAGIISYVRLFDGRMIECSETADAVAARVSAATLPAPETPDVAATVEAG